MLGNFITTETHIVRVFLKRIVISCNYTPCCVSTMMLESLITSRQECQATQDENALFLSGFTISGFTKLTFQIVRFTCCGLIID